jgi:hypothetical protein
MPSDNFNTFLQKHGFGRLASLKASTADPTILESQIEALEEKFGLEPSNDDDENEGAENGNPNA